MPPVATIDIPAWVPPALHADYRTIAETRGEEDAAAWARQAKKSKVLAWTREQVAFLRQRWEDGASAEAIAAEIGFGATRNAVIGKVHRLGLPARGIARPRREKPAGPAGGLVPSPAPTQPPAKVEAPQRVPARGREPAPECGVEILDLREHHCRWPRGAGITTTFCGEPRVQREVNGMLCPYCAIHAQMAYATPSTRTDRQAAGDEKRRKAMLLRRAAA